MTSPESTIEVTDVPDDRRFEVRVDGRRAGYAEYRDRPNRRIFTHTVIDGAYEGRGLGSRLARTVLDDARARGLTVVAECPFIAEYIRTHEEYADLLHERA